MCGISGVINQRGFQIQSIKSMTDIIHHRGPDGEGFALFNNDGFIVAAGGNDTQAEVWTHQSPYKPTESINNLHGIFHVGFGHRRLSILDLSSCGHQPMSYGDGRYWITFNGEVYNYKELREELKVGGYHFHTETDTEVILASYAQWGIHCLQRFNGMWAFAIYDTIEKEIFMARDRFGIKPLYYWFAPDGSFCFASEIKQFTVYPGWDARINPQRAYDYLIYSYTDHTEETMFLGVNQIPGSHYFKGKKDGIVPNTKGKIITSKWYELPRQPYQGTFEQASQQFRLLFKNSVDLHLRADVPVGTALSGGLDSSAIVCQMNIILKEKGVEDLQKTFSCCSYDVRFDEKQWMDIVINHTSVDAHFVYPKLEDVFKITPNLIWFHDEPYQSQSAFLAYNVFKLVKSNNVKVLLNGQGADEYLGGYSQFTYARLIRKIRKFQWLQLYKEIKNPGFLKYPTSFLLRIIVASIFPDKLRRIVSEISSKNLSVIKSLISNKALGSKNINPNNIIPVFQKNVSDISRHQTFYSTLPKYLKWEDRNSMANSIEARVPFLDYKLVEFVYNLPDDYLDFQGETKRILRKGLSGTLPEKIKNRKDKNGYLTPEERWVKEDNPALFRRRIEEAIAVTKGIIKPEALNYFDKVVAGKIPFDYTYWRLILFAEWIKRFDVKVE